MVRGLTLDTGALIAWERYGRRMISALKAAREDDLAVTVPAVVLTEWFRGRPRKFNALLKAVEVEPLTASVAREAGEALVGLPASVSVVDAIVMASASQRDDVVYTSDPEDLEKLRGAYPNVKVLQV